ncbi:HAD family hydrolase [Pseudovibrio sp. Tun.PSC04-5.I4]|uniref:HAD family hydrolase n=1 Tax=Pseudovibrio sp. Tun.PSC04-5.I4 TaxID=1798213 RepID=UPI0008808794|nr:HAD family hydrolase [Pseudovibrio sp. Tun.PSC04-5.I4]SDR37381.1 haloacid dehalogenase superfamily, subfamily IA, variant 1 with third motif having Dx(3-4)D or Dx(3-4)E [Pseudovibrio sp. Tun.PSC04-5.I4]
MFKAIIFDLDGTICHHKASYPKMFHEIFGEQFNKHSNVWLRHMMHNGAHTGMEAVNACFPHMSVAQQKEALEHFTTRWAECQKPFSGIFHAIALLKSHYNCQVGILTNGPSSFQWAVMNQLHVSDYVDFAYASGDAFPAENKPSVGLLRKLESKHGFSANQALFIGDNLEKDINPARAAGWRALHIAPHEKEMTPFSIDAFEQAIETAELLKVNWSTLTV